MQSVSDALKQRGGGASSHGVLHLQAARRPFLLIRGFFFHLFKPVAALMVLAGWKADLEMYLPLKALLSSQCGAVSGHMYAVSQV